MLKLDVVIVVENVVDGDIWTGRFLSASQLKRDTLKGPNKILAIDLLDSRAATFSESLLRLLPKPDSGGPCSYFPGPPILSQAPRVKCCSASTEDPGALSPGDLNRGKKD